MFPPSQVCAHEIYTYSWWQTGRNISSRWITCLRVELFLILSRNNSNYQEKKNILFHLFTYNHSIFHDKKTRSNFTRGKKNKYFRIESTYLKAYVSTRIKSPRNPIHHFHPWNSKRASSFSLHDSFQLINHPSSGTPPPPWTLQDRPPDEIRAHH